MTNATVGRDLVQRDADVFLHQDGSSPCIGAIRRVGGIWIEEMDGHRLVDLHGNTVHHIGHAHPRLIAALKAQLDDLPFVPRRHANEPAAELGERLTARFHGGRSRLLLAPSGTTAIEIAVAIGRAATRRPGIVALRESYHGHGLFSLALSGREAHPDVHHITPYWDAAAGGAERMLADLAAVLSQHEIAALVSESMRSTCIVPPADLWPRAYELTRRFGAKLILDEIPSGLGKTGRFFAHEHFSVTPDIVVLGKALGGGVLPLAAVLADARLDVPPRLAVGHVTHEKNPMLARAALTTLDVIEAEGLVARAAALGEYARKRLGGSIARATSAGPTGMRGLGLLQAITLDPAVSPDRLVVVARRHGISTTTKGPHAIGFSPPLIITESEIDDVLRRLGGALQELAVPEPNPPSAITAVASTMNR